MDESHEISEELMWQGYGNFALFQDTDAKIARYKAQLAGLAEDDHIHMRRHAFGEARHHFEDRIRLQPQHSLGAYVSLGMMAWHEGDPGRPDLQALGGDGARHPELVEVPTRGCAGSQNGNRSRERGEYPQGLARPERLTRPGKDNEEWVDGGTCYRRPLGGGFPFPLRGPILTPV